MLFTSGTLLFYTAMVVPVQIFLWDYSDQCNMFPTLFFDVFVDMFFVVRAVRLLSLKNIGQTR
jgi:hypothetical protein